MTTPSGKASFPVGLPWHLGRSRGGKNRREQAIAIYLYISGPCLVTTREDCLLILGRETWGWWSFCSVLFSVLCFLSPEKACLDGWRSVKIYRQHKCWLRETPNAHYQIIQRLMSVSRAVVWLESILQGPELLEIVHDRHSLCHRRQQSRWHCRSS